MLPLSFVGFWLSLSLSLSLSLEQMPHDAFLTWAGKCRHGWSVAEVIKEEWR